jgi:hypothetical protein
MYGRMGDDGKDKSRFHERLNAERPIVASQSRGSNTLGAAKALSPKALKTLEWAKGFKPSIRTFSPQFARKLWVQVSGQVGRSSFVSKFGHGC